MWHAINNENASNKLLVKKKLQCGNPDKIHMNSQCF